MDALKRLSTESSQDLTYPSQRYRTAKTFSVYYNVKDTTSLTTATMKTRRGVTIYVNEGIRSIEKELVYSE